MASGKTTIGKQLSSKLNIPFYDTDHLIETTYEMSIPTIFDTYGENQFRLMESDILKKLPLKEAVIATGGGIVLKNENINYLKRCTVIWLDVPFEIIMKRLAQDQSRPLWKGQSVERKELYEKRRTHYEHIAHIHLKLKDEHVDDIVEKIVTYLNL